MPCGRFARHDSLGEKPFVGWPLLSCSGSLKDAPLGHRAERTVLFVELEPAALVQPALFG
ncbi:hypothetical protein GCM10010289_85020 [Streptomyces violascens]|nr:hypothetical protein GCM10010289_85020 [Streptomyces violascens]